ncbi:MAG: polyprenyl synthetase family protein [Chlorobi bacterium]|nr:polyprenyl synthetase family protein [Chlorobiota bacterium]
MNTLDKIKSPVTQELKEFEKYFRGALKSQVPLLDIVTRFILRRKGKQIRPLFVLLTSKMLSDVNDGTYTAAALIELLHTATLVHDDVVDDSYERRGFFSLNALWKSKLAVLTGDFLLAKGLLLAIEHKRYDLLEIVSTAVREMSEGEIFQLQKSRKLNLTEDDYFKIIRKKTATLISACTHCGAKAVSDQPEILNDFARFGELVGMAFQIKDDLFDYQSNGTIGKPVGNDLQEKKLTLPVIYALSVAPRNEKKHILSLIRHNPKPLREIREIISFVKHYGGTDYAESVMTRYKNHALEILEKYEDSPAKEAMIILTEFTVTRNK